MMSGSAVNTMYGACAVYSSKDYYLLHCLLRGLRHRVRRAEANKPGLRAFSVSYKRNPPIDLVATWNNFCRGMDQSLKLLLLASPESATSPAATDEVARWLANRSADDIVIVHTRGKVKWDPAIGGFDLHHSSAINPLLKEAFTKPPPVLDMTWAPRPRGSLLPREPYYELVRSTAAAIEDCPESEIVVDPPRSPWPWTFASGA